MLRENWFVLFNFAQNIFVSFTYLWALFCDFSFWEEIYLSTYYNIVLLRLDHSVIINSSCFAIRVLLKSTMILRKDENIYTVLSILGEGGTKLP